MMNIIEREAPLIAALSLSLSLSLCGLLLMCPYVLLFSSNN
jgi:hypothetical protein